LAAGLAFAIARGSRHRHRAHAAALQQALRRRDEQLAHTAHELRTPLTSVLTALELLREGYATTRAETEEFLDEADLAARHLAFLVNDVLDGASMAAGRLRLDLGDHRVGVLVADGLRVLGLQAERRGIAVATSPIPADLAVHTDPRRFLQVLFNLVGNAVKFSAPGQPVRIDVAADAANVRITVVDHGPGVPRELVPRLFEPFERGSSHGQASTGLGLHITRLLVEQMHGRIGYRPGRERGSEFWFELPRAVVLDATIAPKAAAAR
jgi:signal transduction histidine kinase